MGHERAARDGNRCPPAGPRHASDALRTVILGLPVLGYLISPSGPYPLDLFGIPIPMGFAANGSWIAELSEQGHVIGGYLLAALVFGHAAAALAHQFALTDRTLSRMVNN